MKKLIIVSSFLLLANFSFSQIAFEIKSYEKVDSYSIKGTEVLQYYVVKVGVVGNTHTGMIEGQRVEYKVQDTKSFKQAQIDLSAFLAQWLSINYPTIPK